MTATATPVNAANARGEDLTLDRHWAASDANDFEAEHCVYREDAALEYPQSGERIIVWYVVPPTGRCNPRQTLTPTPEQGAERQPRRHLIPWRSD